MVRHFLVVVFFFFFGGGGSTFNELFSITSLKDPVEFCFTITDPFQQSGNRKVNEADEQWTINNKSLNEIQHIMAAGMQCTAVWKFCLGLFQLPVALWGLSFRRNSSDRGWRQTTATITSATRTINDGWATPNIRQKAVSLKTDKPT